MDKGKFWYYVGATVGTVMKFFIIAMAIFGFAYQVWNKEVPYLPIILFLVYQIWAKVFIIYEAVVFLASNPPKETLTPSEIEKLIGLVNFKNINGGGPN